MPSYCAKRNKLLKSSHNVYFGTLFNLLKPPFRSEVIQLKYLVIPLIVNTLHKYYIV